VEIEWNHINIDEYPNPNISTLINIQNIFVEIEFGVVSTLMNIQIKNIFVEIEWNHINIDKYPKHIRGNRMESYQHR
jgi:hypothetical protein